jgi:cyclase
MLTKRIIACLDVRDGSVVKGVRFEQLASAGDPAALARRYNDEGIDEVMLLDVTATLENRGALLDTVARTAAALFIPLGVGGGIRSLADADALFDAGADKVSINSAALARPALITEIASRYGSQAVIVAIDAKGDVPLFHRKRPKGVVPLLAETCGKGVRPPWVYAKSGTVDSGRSATDWAREAADRGAGEILLTSIDRDGTRDGFDCALTAAVASAVSIPVIASGGAGNADHFAEVFTTGMADAALAASIFHFGEVPVASLKRDLARRGLPIRQVFQC